MAFFNGADPDPLILSGMILRWSKAFPTQSSVDEGPVGNHCLGGMVLGIL